MNDGTKTTVKYIKKDLVCFGFFLAGCVVAAVVINKAVK